MVITERILTIGKLQLGITARLGSKDNPSLFFGKGHYLTPNKSSFIIIGYRNKGGEKEEVYVSVLDFPKIVEALENIDYFMMNLEENTEVVGEEKVLRIKAGSKISYRIQMRANGVCLFSPVVYRSNKTGVAIAVKVLIGSDENKVMLDADNWMAFSMQLRNCIDNFTTITNSMLTMGLQYRKGAPRESIKFAEITEE